MFAIWKKTLVLLWWWWCFFGEKKGKIAIELLISKKITNYT